MQPFEYGILYPESMKDAWVKGAIAQNMDKDFVQRIVSQNRNASNSIHVGLQQATHLMSTGDNQVYPTVNNVNGQLVRKPRFAAPLESMQFATPEQAQVFGANQYKRANREGFDYHGE